MLRILLIAVVTGLCCIPTILFGQWAVVDNTTLGGSIVSGHLFFKDGLLWCGTRSLFVSNDTGVTWSVLLNPPALSNQQVTNVEFFDLQHGIVVTTGKLYITNNGGSTWSMSPLNGTYLNACYAGSDSVIVVANGYGATSGMYVSTDRGITFTRTRALGTALFNPYVLYQGNGKLASSEGQHMILSTDYGQSWSATSDTLVIYDSWTFAIDSCQPNTLYMANEDNQHNRTYSAVLKSTDNGSTWTTPLKRPANSINGSITTSRNGIFIQTLSSGIFRSNDGGLTWDSLGGPNRSADCRTILALNNNILLAMDNNGTLWRTNNAGGMPVISPKPIFTPPSPLTVDECGNPTAVSLGVTGTPCHTYRIIGTIITGSGASFYSQLPAGYPITLDNTSSQLLFSFNNPLHRSGVFNDTLLVRWYDESEGVFHDTTFILSATINAQTPKLIASKASVTFDSVSICETSQDSIIHFKNTGCDTLLISSGPGALPPGFLFDSLQIPVVVPPDSVITFHVRFHPVQPGQVTASLRFDLDKRGKKGVTVVPVSARGFGSKPLPLSIASSLTFKPVSNCHPSSDTTIILKNIGCDTVTINTLPAGLSPVFSLSNVTLPIEIPPGGSASFTIVFKPSATGNFQTTLIFFSDRYGLGDSSKITLFGRNIGASPGLAAADSVINFSTISICDKGKDTTATLINAGCDTMQLISGPGPIGAGYTIDPITFPAVLAPGDSITIGIHFIPPSAGVFQTSLTFQAKQRNLTQNLILTLVGQSSSSFSGPTVLQTSFEFDTVFLCAPVTHDTIVTFTNRGCTPLTIISGPGALGGGFTSDPLSLPVVLQPDSSIDVVFHYTPTIAGSSSAFPQYVLERDAVKSTLSLFLHGEAISGVADFFLSSTTLQFQTVPICSSDSLEFLYTNRGCDSVFVTPKGITGDGDFIAVSGSEKGIANGDTIRILVRLIPQQKGNRQAQYTLHVRERNGREYDTTISISGVVSSGSRILSSKTTSLDFGDLTLCSQYDTTISVVNLGCDSLLISDISVTGTGVLLLTPAPVSIAPAATQAIRIQTQLDTTGHPTTVSAILHITSNATTAVADIPITYSIRYPGLYRIGVEVPSTKAKNGDKVTLRIIADSIPLGLTRLETSLAIANTDLLSYQNYSSVNSVAIQGSTLVITGSPIRLAGDELASLLYQVTLSKDSSTSIVFADVRSNPSDPSYEQCVATVTAGDSGSIAYSFACGERMISNVLDHQPPLKILSTYPDPVSSSVTLDVQTATETAATLELSDMTGRIVRTQQLSFKNGINTIVLSAADLPSATYFITIKAGELQVHSSFIKQR